ncbi:DUF4973 domain-containing protein [Parapusillimonas sp. SGNA-6]|uniref:DUF4973 domain-containing protein n=1 Tax=Parapedobacter sp. SGR-10 TaxID=2710879 RepID=UPI0013D014DC|nr:DUF4973 domain-containing protein [Parapedobacter sp. SGR-10]NGF55132.1 DUF4973 domain-containing protein [Parapedobacter sp. SGR-10]NGM89847.1 DUF4973 domain-containing protein [Parapusillimonas sp. SGNA-6]
MKYTYILFLAMTIGIFGLSSCNNEWEDEQYEQLVSFKAPPNTEGVSWTYVRYKPDGKVTFNLPVLISGSTPNTEDRTVRVGLDLDTLYILNREQFGEEQELYYKVLESKYYSIPETVTIPAGQSQVNIPIEFSLADIDESDKWVLPLQILDNPSGNYRVNPHKHYRRAMLRIAPFNDYSGGYDGALFEIILEGNTEGTALNVETHRAYVVDDETVFFYAGTRNVDYPDRKNYKVFVRFTDEAIDSQKKKLEIWSDNADNNKFEASSEQPYYTMEEDYSDITKPYLKRIYITLSLGYKFEDYTSVPGLRLKYETRGMLSMQRDLNTLIPDEDQQIQW